MTLIAEFRFQFTNMLKNTFSKKGWIGAAVLAITLGFLGAFGADLYSLSRATMIRFPFQSIILFVLLLIGIGIVVGVSLIIIDLWSKRKISVRVEKPNVSQLHEAPPFEAEIVDKKQAYVRGKESVSFRSRFKGNLNNVV